jgi:hypothetical protein
MCSPEDSKQKNLAKAMFKFLYHKNACPEISDLTKPTNVSNNKVRIY